MTFQTLLFMVLAVQTMVVVLMVKNLHFQAQLAVNSFFISQQTMQSLQPILD
jgi:hypothetical protein